MADYINNNPSTAPDSGSNTLYFIIGGLVVLALIFGFIYMGNSDRINSAIEPASGTTTSSTTNIFTPDTNTDADNTSTTETTREERTFSTDDGSASYETETQTTTE